MAFEVWQVETSTLQAKRIWQVLVMLRNWLLFQHDHNLISEEAGKAFREFTIDHNRALVDAFGESAITLLLHIGEHADIVTRVFGSLKLTSVWAEVSTFFSFVLQLTL